jgi:hypothetical protein
VSTHEPLVQVADAWRVLQIVSQLPQLDLSLLVLVSHPALEALQSP